MSRACDALSPPASITTKTPRDQDAAPAGEVEAVAWTHVDAHLRDVTDDRLPVAEVARFRLAEPGDEIGVGGEAVLPGGERVAGLPERRIPKRHLLAGAGELLGQLLVLEQRRQLAPDPAVGRLVVAERVNTGVELAKLLGLGLGVGVAREAVFQLLELAPGRRDLLGGLAGGGQVVLGGGEPALGPGEKHPAVVLDLDYSVLIARRQNP